MLLFSNKGQKNGKQLNFPLGNKERRSIQLSS